MRGRQPSVSRIRVRAAKLADVPAMLALEALFPSDRMSVRSIRRFVTAASARVFVATGDEALLGNLVLLLRARSTKARIYSVVVDPQARGLGIGNRLVEAAERAAKCERRSAVTLEVRADNAVARALYAKRGYIEEQRLPRFYNDGADGLKLIRNFKGRNP
ncbi:ribosomal-protein-alanine N-acetyltransferase [Panacagrimonas perspica]|uniref:Ribosomal-protein-alanine N-acetyltransferase n=1 Tax=Panacagrimonas perspica TaxID=381431 RepID=A0A4R7NTR2_9GAMM|nr:GNAT family N-acetyltransferase [Panacagrimonas perspica]TDU24367.1 ribosomal-protein-alanine N-acetyltransferase [Panacagrimonas perspica]THD04755.1 GNAT family N-acetyltransferase [Panacagrimonas perspica]